MASSYHSTSAFVPLTTSQGCPTRAPSEVIPSTPHPSNDYHSAGSTKRPVGSTAKGRKLLDSFKPKTQTSVYNLSHNSVTYEYTQVDCDPPGVGHNDDAMSDLVNNLNSFADPYTDGHEEVVSRYIHAYNQRDRPTKLSMYDAKTHDNRSPVWSASVSVRSEIPGQLPGGTFASKVKSALKVIHHPKRPEGDGWERL